MTAQSTSSKALLWTGNILKILCCAFLAFDAIMKVIKQSKSVEGTVQMGLPEHFVQPLGIYLLIVTILYIIPRTAVLGCLFLLAYLGAATAIMLRANQEGHSFIFPIVFAIVAVSAEYLRNAKLREALPFSR